MDTDLAHAFVDRLAQLLELAGVGIIIVGVALSAIVFVRAILREGNWQAAYQTCRSNLGRGILLGLELLVGADIISTITAPPNISKRRAARRGLFLSERSLASR